MVGLTSQNKEAIGQAVEDLFDKIALQFIGDIPSLKGKKTLVISASKNVGLPHLFVQAMSNHKPNAIERDVLKGVLRSAHSYLEALKNRTRANVTEAIDAAAREAKYQQRQLNEGEIQYILDEEMKKAKAHLKTIAEAESTKIRNMGSAMDISRVSSSLGDDDPNVFFVVIKDDVTCKECIKLHLMPDGITPRVWKFSELKHGYHKRGEEMPSIAGEHPHCRCFLTYISKSFGFKNGRLSYITEGHDEYLHQRKASA